MAHRWSCRLMVESLERREVPTLGPTSALSDLLGGLADEYMGQLLQGEFNDLLPPAREGLQLVGVPFAAEVGKPFDGFVGLLYDAHPSTEAGNYQAVITWGDGTTSDGTVTARADGRFFVSGTHTYSKPGEPPNLPTFLPPLPRELQVGLFPMHITLRDQADKLSVTGESLAIVVPAADPAALTVRGERFVTTAGTSFDGVVATFTDGDKDAKPGDYRATITWGDDSRSEGVVTALDRGGFVVTGKHVYTADEVNIASFPLPFALRPVRVQVEDVADHESARGLGVALVEPAKPQGLQARGTILEATVGTEFSATVATFRDSNASLTDGRYEATIEWGDGTKSAGRISIGREGGFAVTGTHTYTKLPDNSDLLLSPLPPHYGVAITITDTLDKETASVTSTAFVRPARESLSAVGVPVLAVTGKEFTGVVAAFRDQDPDVVADNYSATITWGDGTTSAGTIRAGELGGFLVEGTHTYQPVPANTDPVQRDSFPITVAIVDHVDGDKATAESRAVVRPPLEEPPPPPEDGLRAEGVPVFARSGKEFTSIVAAFHDRNANVVADNYTATITWGDGTTSTGVVRAGRLGGFVVEGTHTYVLPTADASNTPSTGVLPGATFHINVVIVDRVDQDTATTDSRAVVAPPEVPPPEPPSLRAVGIPVAAVSGQAFTGRVAAFKDADANVAAANYTATIDWGDNTTSTGTIRANDEGGFVVEGTHTWTVATLTSAGALLPDPTGHVTFTIHVTIADSVDGDKAATESRAVVRTEPPPPPPPPDEGLRAIGLPVFAQSGQEITARVAVFHDKTVGTVAENYSATITWGDGTSSTGVIRATEPGGFAVEGTHTWTLMNSDPSTGLVQNLLERLGQTFQINVVITDKVDGNTAKTESRAVVTIPLPIPFPEEPPTRPPEDHRPPPGREELKGEGRRIVAEAGTAFTEIVATFRHEGVETSAGDYQTTIAWGDESSSAGVVAETRAGFFTVLGTHTYAERGRYDITVKVVTANAAALTIEARAAIHGLEQPLPPQAATSITRTGASVLANLFADLGQIADQVEVHFGDGSALTVLTDDTGKLNLDLDHHYTAPGTYAVQVTAKDDAGEIGTRTINVTVLPSDSALFVAANVEALLQRKLEDKDLQFVEQTLKPAESQLLQQVALDYVTSPENRARLVQQFYTTFLERTGGTDETGWWAGLLQQGKTPQQILSRIVSSDEYFANAGGTNASWLDSLYHDLLGRDRESDFFLTALEQGATRADVAAAVVSSAEYQLRLISSTYATFLERAAGTGETSYWQTILNQASGTPGTASGFEQFLAGVLGSQEYSGRHGDTLSSWVSSLYDNLLQRPADEGGFQYTLNRLVNGLAAQRQQIALALATGDERQRQEIVDFYEQFLDRTASAGEFAYWMGVFHQGATNEQVLAAIAGSDEALQRDGGTATTWLDQVYTGLLNRQRGTTDTYFLDLLNAGQLNRQQIVEQILASEEYWSKQIQSFYQNNLERAASAGDVAYWLSTVRQGASDEQILAAILGSNEYFQQRQGKALVS